MKNIVKKEGVGLYTFVGGGSFAGLSKIQNSHLHQEQKNILSSVGFGQRNKMILINLSLISISKANNKISSFPLRKDELNVAGW